MKTKRLVAGIFAGVLALGCGTAVAFAETKTDSLSYGGVTADAKLVCKFGFAFLGGADDAKATTDFTTAATKGYQVAARLECWETKNSMIGYKYDRDATNAEVNYNWSDVYCYMSRHSIDNATGSVELDVCDITDVEGIG